MNWDAVWRGVATLVLILLIWAGVVALAIVTALCEGYQGSTPAPSRETDHADTP